VKLVLDSNVILAAFATRGLCEAVMSLCLEFHTLILSDYIAQEVHRRLQSKFKYPLKDSDEIIVFLRQHAELVNPAALPSDICRDPRDVPIIGTAVAGRADVIVTGDDDLLVLKNYADILIINPRTCYEKLRVMGLR
jgi:uncharacterized protein